MFRTFNPSFTDIERRESRESLKTRLDEFYIGYLDGLVFADVDMVKALNGMKLPLFRGLPDFADLSSFYDYIADPETGKYDDRIINQVKDKGEGVISTRPTSLQPIEKETPISVPSSNLSSSSSIFSSRKTTETNQKFSGFLIGPEDTGAEGGAKSFFLGRSREEYKVLVYQYLEDTTLAFFMPTFSDAASAGSIDSTDDSVDSTVNSTVDNDGTRFHSELRKHLEDRLQSLVGLLSDGYVKMRKAIDNLDQPYRYVYFNSINLAFKTSIGGSRAATVPDDLIIALTQMREEMDKYDLEELVFKTSGDLWIAGRKTEGREFHVILPKTDGNLVEVEEEMRKMASQSVFTE
ncbi:vacuolar fusion protein ccz1 [Irineochytrium annulatum]|nr:vacuolar fusion protein ccz1 [Irineochytrium annulatum]